VLDEVDAQHALKPEGWPPIALTPSTWF
jgi:hypothetical protein